MSKVITKTILVLSAVFMLNTASAQESQKFGAGFQWSWPAWGFSGKMRIKDKIAAQAIIAPFSVVSTYSLRGLYTFKEDAKYDLYGYGTAGLMTYNYGFNNNFNESGMVFGGGAGMEINWQKFNPDLPLLLWNAEAGIWFSTLSNYSLSFITFGMGVHYPFDI